MIKIKHCRYHRSQGSVLVVSLILLLVMTLIGVAAIDSSSLQSQMANNSLKAHNLYQASLSEIAARSGSKMQDLEYLSQLRNSASVINNTELGVSTTGPGFTLTDSDCLTQNTHDAFSQSGFDVFSGSTGSPLTGYSLNDYQVFNYEVNAISVMTGAIATSNQTQGMQRAVPAGQN